MRIKVLACKVFAREVSLLTMESEHVIDVTYLRQGLHDTPDLLRHELQEEIDRIDSGDDMHTQQFGDRDRFAGIVLLYGLCSNAVAGLRSRTVPLVVPRAHDCIAMIVGSHKRYKRYFDEHPGTYWYTPGWIEQTLMPGSERTRLLRERYEREYGEDNAEFLMESEQQWLAEYNHCTHACWKELERPAYRESTRKAAEELGWNYDEIPAEKGWMSRILNGNWLEQETLVVPVGHLISVSYDEQIVSATRIPDE